MGGLALALATSMAACDDDEGGKAADGGKSDAATDATTDTAKPDSGAPDTVVHADAADAGADGSSDVSSETGSDVSSEAGSDASAD
jgi:hypothetical protein